MERDFRNFSDERKERAKAVLETREPTKIAEGTYLVPSQKLETQYIVKLQDFYTCNCPDFIQRCKDRGLYCKHIQAVILFQRIRRRLERLGGDGNA